MTAADVGRALAVLIHAYPRAELPEGTQRLYIRSLEDLDGELLMATIKDLIETSEWMPSIAQIRARAMALGFPDIPSPYQAWGVVMEAFNGPYDASAPTGDELIDKALSIITGDDCNRIWWSMQREPEVALAVHRKAFLETYQHLTERAQRESTRARLGLTDPPKEIES